MTRGRRVPEHRRRRTQVTGFPTEVLKQMVASSRHAHHSGRKAVRRCRVGIQYRELSKDWQRLTRAQGVDVKGGCASISPVALTSFVMFKEPQIVTIDPGMPGPFMTSRPRSCRKSDTQLHSLDGFGKHAHLFLFLSALSARAGACSTKLSTERLCIARQTAIFSKLTAAVELSTSIVTDNIDYDVNMPRGDRVVRPTTSSDIEGDIGDDRKINRPILGLECIYHGVFHTSTWFCNVSSSSRQAILLWRFFSCFVRKLNRGRCNIAIILSATYDVTQSRDHSGVYVWTLRSHNELQVKCSCKWYLIRVLDALNTHDFMVRP
ncbi:hypothetical protein KCU90_g44, partial [Aureobasidium melanogenum]